MRLLNDIRLKFQNLGQVIRFRSLIKDDDDDESEGVGLRESANVKKPSWMMPVSHGYHVVEGRSWKGEDSEWEQPDTVFVQREDMDNHELWFYSVSDATIGDSIGRHFQSHFFGRKLKESLVSRKSKETMTRAYAYLSSRAKHESETAEKMAVPAAASAMIINGEKIVIAQMGGYRAIVCRDGTAHQLRAAPQYRGKRHWPRRLISGAMRIPKVRLKACHPGDESRRRQTDSSELVAATDRVDSETEFIILASIGIFEVMRNQEAVDLIRHIDDPQEAAECLAREALSRMSRSNISCLVIRFD